ncbi:MAG: hypothetical protein KDB53_14555, partial [Planctomycetes bacterium]|nr:hypothetical protein [Planctomycetota bacterium]
DEASTIRNEAGHEVLLEGSSGPLILRGQSGQTRFVLVAFPVSLGTTSLVLTPAWPLFIHDLILRSGWSDRDRFPPVLAAGRVFGAAAGTGPVLARRVGGSRFDELATSGPGLCVAPNEEGAWELFQGDHSEIVQVAVVGEALSDLRTRLDAETRFVPPPAVVTQPTHESRTLWLLLLGLVLLTLEWLFYCLGWTR